MLRRSLTAHGLPKVQPIAEVKKIGVLGLGFMGHMILNHAAYHGYTAVGVDSNPAQVKLHLQRAEFNLIRRYGRFEERSGVSNQESRLWREETLTRLSSSTDASVLGDCDLIIESVPETRAAKTAAWKLIGEAAKKEVVLATGTSSMPVSLMEEASGRAGQVVGTHFLPPVYANPVVELVHTDNTTPQTLDIIRRWLKSLKKEVSECKDTPGFIVSRLSMVLALHAMRAYDKGVGSPEETDEAIKLAYGHPIGPFELADYVGLGSMNEMLKEWSTPRVGVTPQGNFAQPKCLKERVAAGKLGRATGEGFFKWYNEERVR